MHTKFERLLSKSLTTLEVMTHYLVVHTGPGHDSDFRISSFVVGLTCHGVSILTVWFSKFDLKFLSQCGSMHNVLRRYVPGICKHVDGTLSSKLTNNYRGIHCPTRLPELASQLVAFLFPSIPGSSTKASLSIMGDQGLTSDSTT